jgi:hypothetical protein
MVGTGVWVEVAVKVEDGVGEMLVMDVWEGLVVWAGMMAVEILVAWLESEVGLIWIYIWDVVSGGASSLVIEGLQPAAARLKARKPTHRRSCA